MSPDLGRRTTARIEAVKNRTVVQIVGSRGRRLVAAQLVDISRGGARILMAERPEPGATLCLRMESPAKTGWVWAHPVRFGARGEVGVRFHSECTGELVMAATTGVDLGALLGLRSGTASTLEIDVTTWPAGPGS